MPLFLPMLGSGGFIGLSHHLLFLRQPFVRPPVRHRAAFVQKVSRDAGRALGPNSKIIIERRRGPVVDRSLRGRVSVALEPRLVDLIKPLVISKLDIVCPFNIYPLFFRVTLDSRHGPALVLFVERKPRVEICGVFRPFCLFGLPAPHLKPNFPGVRPVEEVFRLRIGIPVFENAGARTESHQHKDDHNGRR